MGFDPYWEWLKIPRDHRPPSHYDLLGVSRFEADEKRLRAAYRERYALVRKYAIGAREKDAERLIDELSEAHDCLSRSDSRARYERELRDTPVVTAPPTYGSTQDADAAEHGALAPQGLTGTRSESDTLAEHRSVWPPVKKATPVERVPPSPPPPPPEFAAADSRPSALPLPPPPQMPSWFDSWHRLSALEKWFVGSLGLFAVAAVVVGVVAATGTGGGANEVAKTDDVTPSNAALSRSDTAPKTDDAEILSDMDDPVAIDNAAAAANSVTVAAEPRRGSSVLDAASDSGQLEAAPIEDPGAGSAGPVPLPNDDPESAEIRGGTQLSPMSEPDSPILAPGAGVVDEPGLPADVSNIEVSNIVDPVSEPLDEPSVEELITALEKPPVTAEPEPPVGSDALVESRSPEPDAGGHSLASPESVKLAAKDGAQIHCTWYHSPKAAENGKEVVPVIVVHGWGEERSLYNGLARSLQSQGHAVIVPDLRGHGSSTVILTPVENRELRVEVRGDVMKVNGKTKSPSDALGDIVRYDLEAVKDFLVAKNNAGEVNVQLLCLVASEAGSIVALNWSAADWSWLQPAVFPQGGHVKAVALLSPAMVFKGVSLQQTLANHIIRDRLAVTIIVGEQNAASKRESRRLYSAFNRARPTVPSRDKIRKQDLVLVDVRSHLQGAKLLGVKAFGVDKKIASFIHLRLVNRRHMHPWAAR